MSPPSTPLALLLLVAVAMAGWLAAPADAAPETLPPLSRTPRLFEGLLNWIRPRYNCGPCPLHHCSIDPAVVHGYCCGCARFTDRVPINCVPELTCPLHPEPLCSNYNYMMDCCC